MLVLWPGLGTAQADLTELKLIVNPSIQQSQFDVSFSRAIYTRKLTRWPNGQRVQVFVLSDDHKLHRQFVKQHLGLFPYQLRQIWDRMVFSGLGEAPTLVSDIEEMCLLVSETVGAVGYAPVSKECQQQGVRYVSQD